VDDHALFKAVLDILEYVLVRLDGPGFMNYETLLLPVVQNWSAKIDNFALVKARRKDLGLWLFTDNKPEDESVEGITYLYL
jgi:hypothetical protein